VAREFRAVHVDFGTGDGTFVRRMARAHSAVLFVGIDAIADNLRDASRRAVPNAFFARLALEDAPADLAGFADRLTVLFPWGSLLRAMTADDLGALAKLRAICKTDAEVRFVFEPGRASSDLERRYREAGFALSGRPLRVEEARHLPTTWAKKLGYSGRPRAFREFQGRAVKDGCNPR
jgi:16S rRNA (adenine(1408)-N(1))-methyltransferase